MKKESIKQNKKLKEFYDLFNSISNKTYEKQEYPDDAENTDSSSEASIISEEAKKVNESANEEENKEQGEDILESTSLKDYIKMSKTQRKNLNRKLLNQDSKRLFQEINNIEEELKEDVSYPYNIYIPKDSLDIQVEIKRLRSKLWRQLINLPKNERNTLVPAIKNDIIKLDSLINRGRFVTSSRKQSYIEAQSVLFDLESYIELMRELKYISHAKYINYNMSTTKIGKQLTQLIRSVTANKSSKKDVDIKKESCEEGESIKSLNTQ